MSPICGYDGFRVLSMWFDPSNPVIALCVEGMQVDGESAKALALFEQAWAIRRDDFDASLPATLLPSLCLNLGDSYLTDGRIDLADELGRRGVQVRNSLP